VQCVWFIEHVYSVYMCSVFGLLSSVYMYIVYICAVCLVY